MLQRLLAWKKLPARCSEIRPQLEHLEKREVMDAASTVTALNTIAFYTYLTEQQTLQVIAATPQTGQASSSNLLALQQLVGLYQQDSAQFFSTLGSLPATGLTTQQQAAVFMDEEIVLAGQGIAYDALQIIARDSAALPGGSIGSPTAFNQPTPNAFFQPTPTPSAFFQPTPTPDAFFQPTPNPSAFFLPPPSASDLILPTPSSLITFAAPVPIL